MKNNKNIGIYKIECKIHNISNGIYIGQSSNINRRFLQHKKELIGNYHINKHLQNAWNKYGENNFTFEIIEECPIDKLNEREIYWIQYYDSFKNGYNNTLGGEGQRLLEKIPILCLNDGLVYTIISDIENKYNVINGNVIKCCNGKRRYCGKDVYGNPLVFRYYHNGDKLLYSKDEINKIANKAIISINSKKIICLNTKEIFESIASVQKRYNISNIQKCCNGEYFYCGFYNNEYLQWMYYDEYLVNPKKLLSNLEIEKLCKRITKIICLNDLNIFNSIKEASEFYNIKNYQNIVSCCDKNKKQHSVKGKNGLYYVFIYYNDYIKNGKEKSLEYYKNTMYNLDKRIITLENNKIYKNSIDASNKLNMSNNYICKLCRNKEVYKGLHFMFYKDYLTERRFVDNEC